MATAQPMPAAAQDSGFGDADVDAETTGQPGQDDGSYVIEIRVSGNKDITVCVESGADEAAEEQGTGDGVTGDADGGSYGAEGGGDSDENSQPVKSIKEALTLALEIFRNDGQMPQRADDDFQQGFDQGATK